MYIYVYVEARKIISHEAAGGISGAGMINALERACRIITHLQRPRRVVPTRSPLPSLPFLTVLRHENLEACIGSPTIVYRSSR